MRKLLCLLLLAVLMMSGCAIWPERQEQPDQDQTDPQHQRQPGEQFYVIAYDYKNGDLVGLNDMGEITSIVSYTKLGFSNFDVYDNILYYIDGFDDYVYKIDLSYNDYTPEKLFHVDVNWDLLANKDKIYVSGLVENQPDENSFQMFEYDLSDGSSKLITNDTRNKEFLCTTTNQLFYTRTNGDFYVIDLNNYSETKILDKARIEYGDKSYLYLIQDEYSPEGHVVSEAAYYIYELSTGETEPFNGDLNLALNYNNSVIHLEETRIMKSSYTGNTELLYDFSNSVEIINTIVLLKNKLLIVANTAKPTMDGPIGDELYYLLDINTMEVVEFAEGYYFLNDSLRNFVTLSYED